MGAHQIADDGTTEDAGVEQTTPPGAGPLDTDVTEPETILPATTPS